MKYSGVTRNELEHKNSGWVAASMIGDRRMEEQEAGATGSASGGRAATKKEAGACVSVGWFNVARRNYRLRTWQLPYCISVRNSADSTQLSQS